MIRVSLMIWPDPFVDLHELTDVEPQTVDDCTKSEQANRESLPERCTSFRHGNCLNSGHPCIPRGDCWVKK